MTEAQKLAAVFLAAAEAAEWPVGQGGLLVDMANHAQTARVFRAIGELFQKIAEAEQ